MPAARVPCLIGPTASGKTEVALHLARATDGEIVCCDAFGVYAHMPVLTAAPRPPADVPHHLVGSVDPSEAYSAARFLADGDRLVGEIRARGRTPWIVGGTALYLRGWLKGFGAAVARDEAYRETLRAEASRAGPEAVHAKLAAVDPERAAALHPNDLRRVIRALEIVRETGAAASALRTEWSGPDRVAALVFGLRRETADLDRRIARRTEAMFSEGVVAEARALLRRDLSPEARKVLGLAELEALLSGAIDEATARDRITQRTRRFARKQMTFFRSFRNLHWIDVGPDDEAAAVADRVLAVLAA